MVVVVVVVVVVARFSLLSSERCLEALGMECGDEGWGWEGGGGGGGSLTRGGTAIPVVRRSSLSPPHTHTHTLPPPPPPHTHTHTLLPPPPPLPTSLTASYPVTRFLTNTLSHWLFLITTTTITMIIIILS